MADLKQSLPAAWQRQAWWLVFLLPLSGLYALVTGLIRLSYRLGWRRVYRAPVPVMVIGNITVGGSGKTPLIIHLVKYLQQHYQMNVGVISRGYGAKDDGAKDPDGQNDSATQQAEGDAFSTNQAALNSDSVDDWMQQTQNTRPNHYGFPKLVTVESTPDQVGDEPVLIVQQTGVPMAVAPNRQAAIECLLQAYPETELILSDDGLQHLALARDIEWIVLDAARGIGRGWLLPAGALRESARRLEQSTVLIHGQSDAELQMQLIAQPLQPLNAIQQHDQTKPTAGDRVHAVAGIGHPERFFQQLRTLGFIVIEHAFADHHDYQPEDVTFNDGLPMITTGKDAVKLFGLGVSGWVLPVEAKLSPACYRLLHEQLCAVGLPSNTV